MYKLRQILLTAFANFRRWKKNPQIILAFCLAFIVSFLLSDKVLVFAKEHDTILQMAEPFIWTFGDAQSVLIISLLLLLLFADMPNLGNDVPLFLVRIDRKVWVLGQILSDTRNVSVPLLYPAFYLYLGEQSGICSKYVERYSSSAWVFEHRL